MKEDAYPWRIADRWRHQEYHCNARIKLQDGERTGYSGIERDDTRFPVHDNYL